MLSGTLPVIGTMNPSERRHLPTQRYLKHSKSMNRSVKRSGIVIWMHAM
jgi:hypothetical protein